MLIYTSKLCNLCRNVSVQIIVQSIVQSTVKIIVKIILQSVQTGKIIEVDQLLEERGLPDAPCTEAALNALRAAGPKQEVAPGGSANFS